jgi:hypothetical protein
MGDRERRRRLAGAADRQVAKTDDRDAGTAARLPHPQPCCRAVKGRQGTEQTSSPRLPPEGGLAHQSMIPKSGSRFSAQIIRYLYDACCWSLICIK